MGFEGQVDSWWPELTGWVRLEGRPDDAVELLVEVNGSKAGRVRTRHFRPDVAPGGTPGFSAPLARIVGRTGVDIVRLLDPVNAQVVFENSFPEKVRDVRLEVSSDSLTWSAKAGDLDGLKDAMREAGRLAVVAAHHDGRISSWPASALAGELIGFGFPTLVVDTSVTPISSIPDGGCVINRPNVGWDFGSWATGMAALAKDVVELDHLILCNDSCFGPFGGIGDSIRKMEELGCEFVGLTDGRFGGPHVQSFFMGFRKKILASGVLGRFFDSYSFPDNKTVAVREGELALTRFLDFLGYDYQVVHGYDQLVQRIRDRHATSGASSIAGDMLASGQPVNTTYAAWDLLLDDGFPFVKRNVFTSMGHLVEDVETVRQRLMTMVSEKNLPDLIDEIGSF